MYRMTENESLNHSLRYQAQLASTVPNPSDLQAASQVSRSYVPLDPYCRSSTAGTLLTVLMNDSRRVTSYGMDPFPSEENLTFLRYLLME
jgi:hypothetical protein